MTDEKMPTTIDELLDWWPGNIPFKGELINLDGSCMCAQGQVLHLIGGMSPDELRRIEQAEADRRTAELLGISLTHAILLRKVNDEPIGAPTCVLREPEKVLGSEAQTLLAFWRQLDRMAPDGLERAQRVCQRHRVGYTAHQKWSEAMDAASISAKAGAGLTSQKWAANAAQAALVPFGPETAWAARCATNEIQGAAAMRERGQPFFFLPLFGFADPEAVLAADREAAQ
jgi:hypothetical protein